MPTRSEGFQDNSEQPADDASVYVERYVRAILRRWLLILACAVLGGTIAFWVASGRPLRYQGVTTLLVVPPSGPGGAQINPATFRAIVENGKLASQVIAELKLEGELSPQGFVERALSVEEVRGTNIVRVKVTLIEAAKAAEASRRLAHKAILLTQQITQQEGAAVQEQLKTHLSDAHDRLAIAEKELLSYKQNAQVDVVEEDTKAQLKERSGLLPLVVSIEAERARLGAAEAELKRQQPLLSTPRAPAAEEALRRMQPESAAEVSSQHLDLSNPFVNPVYQTLDFQIATSRTRIAALEKQRDELTNVKKLGGKELAQLNDLYQRQIELARRQATFDVASKVYEELSLRYEQSRTRAFGNTAQLQVVDDAMPPELPVARRRLEYAIAGAGFGLVVAALFILFWEAAAGGREGARRGAASA